MATSYTDASVTNGVMYFYVVSAVNAGGESTNSAEITSRPTAPITSGESVPPTISVSGSSVQLTVAKSVVGHTYQLQTSDSLVSWTDVGYQWKGTGGALVLPDTAGLTGVARRFYRILIQQ